MVYKNLFLRVIISFLLFVTYLISLININFLLFFALLIYLLIFLEVYKFFNKYLLLTITYLSISFFCCFVYLYNYFDIYIFNLLIFTIIIFDSFSYFIGIFFGNIKIFKQISPKKTLEGYLGGVIITNFIYFFYTYSYFDNISNNNYILLINFIIIFSIFGDLIQSFFKRKNNIKDSSNFLPGHGGFFDRFDSFISSIILLLAYTFIYL